MAPALDETDQLDIVRRKAERVAELVTSPRSDDERRPEEDEETDSARFERRLVWYRDLQDALLDLSMTLPQGVADYDGRKLLEFLVSLKRAIDADPEARDPQGEVELAVAKTGDVLFRVTRRLLHEQLDEPDVALRFVLDTLANVPVGDVARLLGVSTKTVGSWRSGKPVKQNAERVVVVAQLISYLRASLTSRGLLMWFEAQRPQLDGATPRALLDAGVADAHAPLVRLARGSRGQLAA